MANSYNDTRWWLRDEGEAHKLVHSLIDRIEKEDSARIESYRRYVRLYDGSDLRGLEVGSYYRTADPNRITVNIIASVIDAAGARITKASPRPTFLTDGADWSKQRQAKNLTRFMEGALYQTEAYESAPWIFRDAAIIGDGLAKVFSEEKRIKVQRTFPWEVFVDPCEAYYNDPRQLFERKLYDRAQLMELYPKLRDEIKNAGRTRKTRQYRDGSVADQVLVVEAWHLPSGERAKDGRHVIALENVTLVDDEWKRDTFPFARFQWKPKPLGWWGQGIAEQLLGKQYEINLLLEKIQEIYKIWGKPWLFGPRGANIQKSHITDELDTYIEYDGEVPPSLQVFRLVAPEMYEHLERLIRAAYEESGVNQMSASATKPAGIDAAIALRELDDLQSERLAPQSKAYSNGFMQISELVIEEATSLDDYTVKVADRHEMEELDFDEIDLDRDAYVMRMFPTSALSQTPAYRLQQIKELMAEGFISREDAVRLLDFPDLDAHASRELAPYHVIEKAIEKMLDDGEPFMPEPYLPLAWGKRYATAMYCWGRLRNAPDEHLELVREFITACDDLEKQMAGDAAAGAVPGAPPIAPPPDAAAMGAPPGVPLN